MIEINNVSMNFPVPRRFREYARNPFRKNQVYNSIKNVSMTIYPEDRVAFLGVNGAGKTTLLKLIGGLLYPTQGQITINGYDTVRHSLKARKKVGFVLNEERSFYWRLTGVQNLQFFGSLDNLRGRELEQKITELLALVGLHKDGHKLFATYSSGMKQRLAIARGLLSDPQILILDEPTRTLDPEAVADVKHLLAKRIQQHQQRSLLIATHRFDEVEDLCNRVCVMRQGKLLSFDSLDHVRDVYGSVANYYQSIVSEPNVLQS